MFNNHLNYYMPNLSVPPPPPPQHLPRPLNSTRAFFRPHSQPPPFYLPSHMQPPHMNPQFFNLSIPPPPVAIASLISANINNNPTHPFNRTHITTSERFSKTFHNGRVENGLKSKNDYQLNLSRKRYLEQITNEESTSGELRIEFDTAPKSRPLSGLAINADEPNTEEVDDESPGSKESRCSEHSQESIYLVSTDNDSDGEHPEMGRNWRVLMLFNGLVKDAELAQNCERPQTDAGRTYPGIQKKDIAQQRPEEHTEREQGHHHLVKPVSSKSLPEANMGVASTANAANEPVRAMASTANEPGKAMCTNNVWVSNDLLSKMKQQQQTVQLAARNGASNSHSVVPPATPEARNTRQSTTNESDLRHSGERRRLHHNRSLIILKNGRRVYAGSKDCFQFLETGNCLSGVFCEFEHEGVTEQAAKKVCPNLMRGQCRNSDDTCPNGPHSTLKAHQMPICDFYLKMRCSKGKDECPYLHVKHTDGMEPCEEFNKGCCQQGVMCDAPHRYRYHRIKEKQMERQKKQSANQQNNETESHNNVVPSISTANQNDTLKWFS